MSETKGCQQLSMVTSLPGSGSGVLEHVEKLDIWADRTLVHQENHHGPTAQAETVLVRGKIYQNTQHRCHR